MVVVSTLERGNESTAKFVFTVTGKEGSRDVQVDFTGFKGFKIVISKSGEDTAKMARPIFTCFPGRDRQLAINEALDFIGASKEDAAEFSAQVHPFLNEHLGEQQQNAAG